MRCPSDVRYAAQCLSSRLGAGGLSLYDRARMADYGTQWWLELPDGTRRRVGPAGLLIGRSADCDLVLNDEHASRRHAIVHRTAEGLALVSLGRVESTENAALADGTRLSFPGLMVTVRASSSVGDGEPSWVLRLHGGGVFGVSERGLSVGNGPDDDLRIPGCAPRSALFRVARGQLLLEAGVALGVSAHKAGLVQLDAGTLHRLSRGNVVHLGRARISVIVGGATYLGTTLGRGGAAAQDMTEAPSVRLQFLPRGGRLFVELGGEETVVYLAGRRCDLAACLLQPPAPHVPGDPIPDDVLIPRVWPGGTETRSAVGVLLHRLRRDLVDAGLDGVALVERVEGGGATRFVVPPGASVTVE